MMICLQETFLKENDNVTIFNFTSYNYINNNADRTSGGASILITNKIPQCRIILNTKLQTVAASITLHCTITVCSLYTYHHMIRLLTPN